LSLLINAPIGINPPGINTSEINSLGSIPLGLNPLGCINNPGIKPPRKNATICPRINAPRNECPVGSMSLGYQCPQGTMPLELNLRGAKPHGCTPPPI